MTPAELKRINAMYDDGIGDEERSPTDPAMMTGGGGSYEAAPVSRLAVWVSFAALATLPIIFINLPVPGRPSVMQTGITLAAFLAPLAFLGRSHQTGRPRQFTESERREPAGFFDAIVGGNALEWFVGLNLLYLFYMAGRSAFFGDETSPGWFLAKGVVLVGAASTAILLRNLSSDPSLPSTRDHSPWLPSDPLARLVIVATITAVAALTIGFSVGLYRSDATLTGTVGQWVGGERWGYMRAIQTALGSYTEMDPRRAMRDLPVYRNSIAEAVAVLTLISLATDRGRSIAGRLLPVAATVVVLFSLSRSALLVWAVGLLFFAASFVSRRSARLGRWALVVILACVVGWGGWQLLDDTPFVDRLTTDITQGPRAAQIAKVFQTKLSATEVIIGSGANRFARNHRIHNLLLSSFIEGGLSALLIVIAQYAILVGAGWRSVTRGSPAIALIGLLIVGMMRTLVAGGGGYYTTSGMLAVAVFLTLRDTPRFRGDPDSSTRHAGR